MRHFHSQLKSLTTGLALTLAGGVVFVTAANSAEKLKVYDPNTGNIMANPVPLVNGSFEFNVEDDQEKVDMYIISPTGHCTILRGIQDSGDASVLIDTSHKSDTIIIPFSAVDQAGDNVETDTGFDLPVNAVINAPTVDIITGEAGATIQIGTLSTETGGDPALMAGGATLANAATIITGAVAAAGVVIADAVSVSYTLSAGAVDAAGFIKIPVKLPAANL